MNDNTANNNFDFLNFDIDQNSLYNGLLSPGQQGTQQNMDLLLPQEQQLQQQSQQFEHQFLDELDNFEITPGEGVIEEGEDSNDTPTPLQFDQTNFIDLEQALSPLQNSNNGQNLPLNSYQSTNYGIYNNLSFNNNNGNNLTNIISPNDFSDFENSSYSSSFQHGDSLKSPPMMNSPTFSPSSLSSSAKHLSKDEKLRRRREFHNAVERRRRDLIKDRIKELGQLIPPSLLFDVQLNKDGKEVIKESRANKSIILNKTVEYILNLQGILASQDDRLNYLKNKLDELS